MPFASEHQVLGCSHVVYDRSQVQSAPRTRPAAYRPQSKIRASEMSVRCRSVLLFRRNTFLSCSSNAHFVYECSRCACRLTRRAVTRNIGGRSQASMFRHVLKRTENARDFYFKLPFGAHVPETPSSCSSNPSTPRLISSCSLVLALRGKLSSFGIVHN